MLLMLLRFIEKLSIAKKMIYRPPLVEAEICAIDMPVLRLRIERINILRLHPNIKTRQNENEVRDNYGGGGGWQLFLARCKKVESLSMSLMMKKMTNG